MSRTYRKDKHGNKYPDGRPHEKVYVGCGCFYCTGTIKQEIKEKIADREMKKDVKNALEWNYTENLLQDEYNQRQAA